MGARGAYWSGLAIVDTQVISQGLMDATCSTKHARSCAADHNMILANLASVKHGVKSGYLQYISGKELLQ